MIYVGKLIALDSTLIVLFLSAQSFLRLIARFQKEVSFFFILVSYQSRTVVANLAHLVAIFIYSIVKDR
jgi:hypothetical protein